MRFSPFKDPLWWFCVALFWLNRFVLKPNFSATFLHSSLNDVLGLPIFAPLAVWILWALHLRKDEPPRALDVAIMLLMFTLVFEVWLPHTTMFGKFGAFDVGDVLAYASGGCVGLLWWSWRERKLIPA